MKLKITVTLCALMLGLAAGHAQEVKLNIPKPDEAAAAPAPAAPAANFSEIQLAEEFGWYFGKRVGLSELQFTPEQVQALVKGFTAAATGGESPYDLEKVGPAMDKFMQAKQASYLARVKAKGKVETEKFFADVKARPGVVTLPSGLAYEIVKPGEGPAPKPDETVKVHYTGALTNGSVFDSSVQRGEPVEFQLNSVIPGWTEGLQKISKGGKIKLYIPPQLAYGEEDHPGIPPSSTLVFEVELLDIKPTSAAAPVVAPEAPAKK